MIKPISEETRAKMRAARLGKKHSAETRAKMSAAARARKRRPHSEETKRKIAQAHLGMKHSEESRAKMSASHSGVPLGADHRRNLAAALPRKERHHLWKGDDAAYCSIHEWLTRTHGRTHVCERCSKKTSRTEWANITGIYGREDRGNWQELCVTCHRREDAKNPKRPRLLN